MLFALYLMGHGKPFPTGPRSQNGKENVLSLRLKTLNKTNKFSAAEHRAENHIIFLSTLLQISLMFVARFCLCYEI